MQTTEHPTTNDEFARLAHGAAEAWRREIIGTNPDGDWKPLFMVQHPDGHVSIPSLPDFLMESDHGKEIMAAAIGDMVSHKDVTRAALMLSAWITVVKPNADGSIPDIDDRPRPREAVDRIELLVLHVVDQEGEQTWHAEIKRDGVYGPTLMPWQVQESVGSSGRFPEAMNRIREQRTTREIVGEKLSQIIGDDFA